MAEHKRSHPPIPVIVILVLALIGGGWWWWSSTQTTQAAAGEFSGTIEAKTYQVSPALAGRVTEVLAAEGDQVAKSAELVRLDDAALKLQLDQAQRGQGGPHQCEER